MKSGKIWGTTAALLQTPFIEIHDISIKPEMQCSWHKHDYKWNLFYCISGEVEIHVRKNDYDLVDVTTLKEREWTTVPPGEVHCFKTLKKSAEVMEVYYIDPLNPKDIVRESVGGKREK